MSLSNYDQHKLDEQDPKRGVAVGQPFHMCICIAGALKNPRALRAFTNDNGTRATPSAVKEFLKLKQSQGWRVLPMGKCDNFDPQTGCRGHKE